MEKNVYDVVIVGGGVIGSSIAYNLVSGDNSLNVAVVEMDPTYTKASTTLSMSNVRIQFGLKENIQISQYAFTVLERFEEEMVVEDELCIAYHPEEGNLFLAGKEDLSTAEEAFNLQKGLDCPIEWWSPEKIKEKYPLYDLSNFVGGAFGSHDGHIDAYAVLMGYKAKARSLGADFIKDEVVKITAEDGRVNGVRLTSGKELTSKYVINCAGAWANKVAETVGVQLPIDPIKRQIFVLSPAVKPEGPLPLTVLPSGLYFRTETCNILLGKSMDKDHVGFDFTWDDKRFTEELWPELAEFVPAFDTVKLVRGWAGLYAVNTLDSNAILGEWPELKGFLLANGFSGHGLQQAPAVGRYISELILGKTPELDLSIFQPERIIENKPLAEIGVV